MVVKAKKKSQAKSVKKVRPIDEALKEYEKIINARLRIAESTYEAQDSKTQEVIDRIRDRLRIAATGVVMINGKPYKLDPRWIDFNLLFLACEILLDLYMNGIRVANFRPIEAFCAECKKEILGVREPKKRRR